jgi:hypothetical protein
MSLVREQSVFLLQACELIRKAGELGFSVSAGELYRTPEQQALHVKNGRSTTMSSQHLKRLAIDLNFFRDGPDGTPQLIYDVEALRPLGQFWEDWTRPTAGAATGPVSRTRRISSVARTSRFRPLRRRRASSPGPRQHPRRGAAAG